MTTNITTYDIRDSAITSEKLDTNIRIGGELSVDSIETLEGIESDTTDYLSFYKQVLDPGTSIVTRENGIIATGKLIVADDYDGGFGKLDDTNTVYIQKNVRIDGELVINGGSTTIESEVLNIADNTMNLNSNLSGTDPAESAGINVNRGSSNSVSLMWDEGDKSWTIDRPDGSDVISSSRIIDESYGNDTYVQRIGSSMTGPLLIEEASNGVKLGIYTRNNDGILRLGNSSADYGFDFKYTGTETGINNSLELWTDGSSAGDVPLKVFRVQQDGKFRVEQEAIFNSNISIPTDATIDGVDISSHHSNGYTDIKHVTDEYLAGLAGTSGAPSGTNKYVTNSDSRLTNDRTPLIHGEEKHNALPYFDTLTDGTTSASASAGSQNILFSSKDGLTISVKNDTSGYDGEVEIGGDLLRKYTSDTPSDQAVNGNVSFNNDLTVEGNLTVNGTTTYVNTTQLNIGDNIMTLNSDLEAGISPTEDAGIEINRGLSTNRTFKWDEGNDMWEADYHLRINGGDLKLNDSVGSSSYTLKGYSSGNEVWGISDGTTSSSIKVSTSLDNDKQVEFKYTPGSVGASAGILDIGQTIKNNANFTHGETNLYTNGIARLTIDSSGRVGMGTAPTEQLDVAGNIRSTGNIVLNSLNPEIQFNGTSDDGVDIAIKATPEGLDFYEPEDGDDIQFQIFDGTGVNSPYGYEAGGNLVIDGSRNISANDITADGNTNTQALSSTTIQASGNISSQGEIAADTDLKTTGGSVNIQDKVRLEWDEATQSLDFNFM